ncbi:MAG: CapA family protein [bacterium]|nr:CapA family protein [bacterium]MDY4099785.1 CapA family protein [Lachnospiraceae bacterium]
MTKKKCSIAFTGDIGFDRYMAGRWTDPGLLSKGVLDFLRDSDHVVANVEGALYEGEDTQGRGVFFHTMNPEATCVLEAIKSDVWNISNNHIMDAGPEGLVSTRKIASEMGCRTIGAGVNEREASEPVYFEEAGGIGMFGVAYMKECIPAGKEEPGVFRWDDLNLISERIKEVKKAHRWCIIVAHGGEEFADLPNPYTRDRYLKYLELGADLVVAHHPHVPENYETFADGKAIFYSLGNFIFDTDYQRAHPYTDIGVLLKVHFTEETMTFEAKGTKIIRGEERIEEGALPAIFADVREDEYRLLSPLASSVFMEEERKKMIYLEPERFTNASQEVWDAYYFSTEPDGYDEGAHMDLSVIVPYAALAEKEDWKRSKLTKVVDYLFRR